MERGRVLEMNRNKNSGFTFSGFLCGAPQGDYIFQNVEYYKQIKRAAEIISDADYILIGAGAGLSTAAGAEYGGKWFEENFAEFRDRYGTGPHMQDMYSAGFYPFPDEEAFWGYWSKHALLGGVKLDVTPLHKVLLSLCEGKHLFVLSTNVDGQFVKAGLPEDQIFCTQGDYFHIQCSRGCHRQVYDARDLFARMDEARKNCRIPSNLVPKCPVCGGPMSMNLRSDNYFVEDSAWHEAERRFGEFLYEALSSDRKVCLLEVGVGFNTPIIIRFPFEKLAKEHEQMSLVRLNLKEAFVPAWLGDRAVGINADMARSIEDIAAVYR